MSIINPGAIERKADYEDTLDRSFEEIDKLADSLNCDVLLPTSNQIFVDIDGPDKLQQTLDMVKMMSTLSYKKSSTPPEPFVLDVQIMESRTPGHKHVIISVKGRPWQEMTRIALQAIFGSDPKRELLHLVRYINGEYSDYNAKVGSCFFRPRAK